MMNRLALIALLSSSLSPWCISAFTTTHHSHRHGSKLSKMTLEATKSNNNNDQERRSFLTKSAMATFLLGFQYSNPASVGAVDVDDFLQTGMVSMPMGVSGQAGKARPETGVFLRDGSEVSRNEKTGDVLAEIVLNAKSDSPTAVLTSFVSPWPLAKGAQFDVECRDSKTGDGAFLAVTSKLSSQNNLADLPSSYFVNQLFSPTGRFSFYGAPTDIKIKKSRMLNDNTRLINLSFSSLSQSTMTEIPRNALVAVTIPEGAEEAVMLVGSASANRWKKGAEEAVTKTVESFRAVAAPKSSLKIRAKDRTDV
uniref:Uncharacterized protein n=1 Tax=Helicotheca tamesis TaxID=374047 RepID=A0A7S2E4M5_9STRA